MKLYLIPIAQEGIFNCTSIVQGKDTKHLPTAVMSMSVTSMVKGTSNVLFALRTSTRFSPSGTVCVAGSKNTINSLSSMQKRKRKIQNGSAEYGDSKQKCHTSVIKSAVGRKKYISEGEQMDNH